MEELPSSPAANDCESGQGSPHISLYGLSKMNWLDDLEDASSSIILFLGSASNT